MTLLCAASSNRRVRRGMSVMWVDDQQVHCMFQVHISAAEFDLDDTFCLCLRCYPLRIALR